MTVVLPEELASRVEACTGHRWWNFRSAFEFKAGSFDKYAPKELHSLLDRRDLSPALVQEVQNFTNMPWWVSPELVSELERIEAQLSQGVV